MQECAAATVTVLFTITATAAVLLVPEALVPEVLILEVRVFVVAASVPESVYIQCGSF